MHGIISTTKKAFLYAAVLTLGGFGMLIAGGVAYADDPSTCTPPPPTTPGVHWPTGADAGTFTYQCYGPYAGEWINQYYVYDPSTGIQSPLYSPDYSYNCSTDTWTMVQWDYDAASGSYVEDTVVPSTAPDLPTGCPVPPQTTSEDNSTPSSSASPNDASDDSGSSISNTGPGSTNSTTGDTNADSTTTNNTGVVLDNGLTSDAATGDAVVTDNTNGGDATSGNADAIANIANLLQSTSNVFGPNTVMFTANINGDVNGDILLNPSTILSSGPSSTNTASNNLQVNTDNTNNTNAGITNNVNLDASSGDATVASNTNGGNATSGNADAIANLMNLINSTVSAGQSFVGTININGDLNGNILLPQDLVNELLASSGPNSTNTANNDLADTSTTANNTTESVNNNLNSNATTGNASVTGNTAAGSATSGTAGTNVTLLNLTGSNTVGSNDLLVFVNVLGTWVGMIMNAPAGSTAAELGGGITSSGPNSTNATESSAALNSNTTNNANLAITNNVNATAQSGNATVTNNTQAGNATSGNADTAMNILNLEGSNLSLSNWFGILFINVFGIWNGSFGVAPTVTNTAATSTSTENPVQAATRQSLLKSFHQFATFLGTGDNTSTSTGDSSSSAVLGASTVAAVIHKPGSHVATVTTRTKKHASYTLTLIGTGLAAAILLAGERDRISRVFKRKQQIN